MAAYNDDTAARPRQPAPPSTFAQMQQQGLARPAPMMGLFPGERPMTPFSPPNPKFPQVSGLYPQMPNRDTPPSQPNIQRPPARPPGFAALSPMMSASSARPRMRMVTDENGVTHMVPDDDIPYFQGGGGPATHTPRPPTPSPTPYRPPAPPSSPGPGMPGGPIVQPPPTPNTSTNPGGGPPDPMAERRRQLAEALYGQTTGLVNNPSRYGSAEAMQTFDMMNQRLGDEYQQRHDRLTSDASRRGVYYSTAPDVGYRDNERWLAGAQRDLGTSIAMDQARTYGEDTRGALAAGMGLDQQAFQQALQEAMFNRQLDQDQVNFLLQLMGVTGG